MKPNTLYLPLTEFCFVYKAVNEIKIPPFPGKLLHGAFGNALYNNVCRVPGSDCKSCMFKKQCAYSVLFKSQYSLKTGDIKDLNNAPSPHIFRFQNQGAIRISAKNNFTIKMVLIANAQQQVSELFSAMRLLGEKGISHNQARLTSIKQINVSNGVNGVNLPRHITTAENVLLPEQPQIPDVPTKIRIEFVTPWIQSAEIKKQHFTVQYWLMGIIRRIAILQNIYTDQMNKADFVALKEFTLKAKAVNQNLYYYKTTQTEKNYTSGLLGSLELQLEGIEELWSWLYLGQWVNTGKKTSHGFGRYRLVTF